MSLVRTLVVLLAATAFPLSASATTLIYDVVSGGLADGFACLSSAGTGACASSSLFDVDGVGSVTGTITLDDVLNTAEIDITLTLGSMTGAHDSVAEIDFAGVRYLANGWATNTAGDEVSGTGTRSGSLTGGTYTQLDGSSGILSGPTGFGELADFSDFSCTFTGTTGQCDFTAGADRDLDLPVSGDSLDFVHTFNVGVSLLPEPARALLVVGAMLAVARAGRRSR